MTTPVDKRLIERALAQSVKFNQKSAAMGVVKEHSTDAKKKFINDTKTLLRNNRG